MRSLRWKSNTVQGMGRDRNRPVPALNEYREAKDEVGRLMITETAEVQSDAFRHASLSAWFEKLAEYAEAVWEGPLRNPFVIDVENGVLRRGNRIVWRSDNVESLYALGEWYVTRCWAEQIVKRYVICHAATVERNGVATMMVGEPGAGKSTLALNLLARGYRYLSDEFAIIDPKTLEAMPLPNGLNVKNEESAVWGSSRLNLIALPYPRGFRPRYDSAYCCIPPQTAVPPPGARFPIRTIAFLEGKPGTEPAEKVKPTAGAVALFNASGRGDAVLFETVTALARSAEMWKMQRRAPQSMADHVETMMEG